MKQLLSTALTLVLFACAGVATAQQTISLAGAWDFSTKDTVSFDDYVMLPGSMLTNGKGNVVSISTPWTGSLYDSSFYFNPYMEKYRQEGAMKFPFFLTPSRHYVGNAWYRRSVYVPQSWQKQRVTLYLERPHIETTVYVNGREAGHQQSLSAPHEYDVTKYLRFGARNEIVVKVYNGIENVCVGQDSHSVTDQTQGNWNGITGRLELQARPRALNIRQVRVYPDVESRTARVVVELDNHVDGLRLLPLRDYGVTVEAAPVNGRGHRVLGAVKEALGKSIEFTLHMGEGMQTWDEFSPSVYRLTAYAGDDVYETTFGMRDISVRGRQLYINGRPLFIRGTVENCCFPLTGYPPTDVDEWLRVFRKCKEYGLNMVRFHSYCPPEAAFAAADQVGIYLQPEGPSWPNHGVKLRRGMKIDQYLLEESRRIIDTYGNHPSFVMMAAGNEPAGDWVSYCNDWVRQMHQYDSTKIYCGASVGGGWAWDSGSEYHVKGGARGLDWDRRAPQSSDDYYEDILRPRNYKGTADNNSPILAHEQGQWCAFPDLSETSQYTGAYQAGNFDIFRDLLERNGMGQLGPQFLMASGRLQTLCYKYEIERNLRTPDYAGFQLLGLNDYSGQGTALVGPLNVFWREKGYCSAREWRQFCAPVVLLARFPKFVFTASETLRVPVEMYNAYSGDFRPSTTVYSVWADDTLLYTRDTLSTLPVSVGKNNQLGVIMLPLNRVTEPTRMRLVVQTENVVQNSWEFWVYPDTLYPLAGEGRIYVADSLDERALKVLRKGGSVLLTAAGKVTLGSDVRQTYLPVFWNTSWFKMRPPHTTGAYIRKDHPLFRHGFPTDDWSNLNWWELLNRAQVMNLMELPSDYQSPIQPIDTWHVSRKLGMLVEGRVGKGRLLMTTMDITNDLEHRVVARQMRHAILSYMLSDDFRPSLELTPEFIRDFYTRQAPPVNMFTNDSPDELKPKLQ